MIERRLTDLMVDKWNEERKEERENMRVRVRPGRAQSLAGGLVALAMGLFACAFFGGLGGEMMGMMPGPFALFPILFLFVVLVIAALSFYNAFSKEGIATYEVDIESQDNDGFASGEAYCPNCGKPVGNRDRFCRHCGHALREK